MQTSSKILNTNQFVKLMLIQAKLYIDQKLFSNVKKTDRLSPAVTRWVGSLRRHEKLILF